MRAALVATSENLESLRRTLKTLGRDLGTLKSSSLVDVSQETETRLLEYRDSLQSLIAQFRHVRDISRCKFDLAIIPWVVIRRARTVLTPGKWVYCINDPTTQQVLFWRVMQERFALKRQHELSGEHGASLGTMLDLTEDYPRGMFSALLI